MREGKLIFTEMKYKINLSKIFEAFFGTINNPQFDIQQCDNRIRFWVSDGQAGISRRRKTDFKKRKYRLNWKEDRFIKIKMTITNYTRECKFNLNHDCKPSSKCRSHYEIETEFKICAYMDKRCWFRFMEAFTKIFEPLSSQGSYINKINIKLHNCNNRHIMYFKIGKTLNLLKSFKVHEVILDTWALKKEEFEIVAELKKIMLI